MTTLKAYQKKIRKARKKKLEEISKRANERALRKANQVAEELGITPAINSLREFHLAYDFFLSHPQALIYTGKDERRN